MTVGLGVMVLIWTSVAAPGTAAGFQLPAANQSVEVLPVHWVWAFAKLDGSRSPMPASAVADSKALAERRKGDAEVGK